MLSVPVLADRLAQILVASLHGLSVHPKAPGVTWADVWVGGIVDMIHIVVYERVSTSDALLRPCQLLTVSPLRLAGGETRQWHLRPGTYDVAFRADTVPSAASTLSTAGATCSPWFDAYHDRCVVSKRATVVVTAPEGAKHGSELGGSLTLARWSP